MARSFYYIAGAAFVIYLLTMKTGKAFAAPTASGDLRLCDNHGCGSFNAGRGNHSHQGLDFKASPGEAIFAPISGTVTRYPYPYAGDYNYTGIEIVNVQYKVKIFYMAASVAIGSNVQAGQKIGIAQNIAAKYSPGMTNHVHFEVYDHNGNLINPTALIAGLGLNYNLVLKQGMYNLPEVSKLQEFLGITADGDFGPQTEAQLMAKKGVNQIALKDF